MHVVQFGNPLLERTHENPMFNGEVRTDRLFDQPATELLSGFKLILRPGARTGTNELEAD